MRNLFLSRDNKGFARFPEPYEVRELRLHHWVVVGAKRTGHQQRQSHDKLGVYRVTDLRLDMYPVELPLRVPLRVVRVPDVLDALPRNEDVVEVGHPIKLVADRRQGVIVRLRFRCGVGLAAHQGKPLGVYGDERINRLFRGLPGCHRLPMSNSFTNAIEVPMAFHPRTTIPSSF